MIFVSTRGLFFSSFPLLLLFSVGPGGWLKNVSKYKVQVPEGSKQQQAHALDLVGARQAGRKELLTSTVRVCRVRCMLSGGTAASGKFPSQNEGVSIVQDTTTFSFLRFWMDLSS